ncbi:MAG: PmoA family protein [Planctomycetes bacterium]|nr:PmoA family protein [Planctomycetota bacterium]
MSLRGELRTLALGALALLAGCAGVGPVTAPGASATVAVDVTPGATRVSIADREAFVYCTDPAFAIPHVYPLRSPSGRSLLVQRTEPYPHHRALWIADKVQLGDGPVVDYYHEWRNLKDAEHPELGHVSFIRPDAVRAGPAGFVAEATWMSDPSTPVLADTRRFAVEDLGDGEYLVDLQFELRAAYGPVTFRSDKVHYAWPYLRMEPAFSVASGGTLVDDRGRVGQQATDGEVAAWVDYSNALDGVAEGVAVFTPPDGTPRVWLTRDYGTFGPRRPDAWSGTGFTLAAGESLSGHVGILVHRGDAQSGRVAERYAAWAAKAGPR